MCVCIYINMHTMKMDDDDDEESRRYAPWLEDHLRAGLLRSKSGGIQRARGEHWSSVGAEVL